jgi:hypothetical protein
MDFCNYDDELLDSVQAWEVLTHLKITILKCFTEIEGLSFGYVCVKFLQTGFAALLDCFLALIGSIYRRFGTSFRFYLQG